MSPRSNLPSQNKNQTNNPGPDAHIYAVIDRGNNERSQWIPIGSLWRSQNSDSLSGQIDATPVAWFAPGQPHRIVIRFVEK